MLEELFPRRLKQLRKQAGLTQEKLGATVGVDGRTIRRWERGDRWPEPGNIQALAQALGVPIRELVTFPEHPEI